MTTTTLAISEAGSVLELSMHVRVCPELKKRGEGRSRSRSRRSTLTSPVRDPEFLLVVHNRSDELLTHPSHAILYLYLTIL